ARRAPPRAGRAGGRTPREGRRARPDGCPVALHAHHVCTPSPLESEKPNALGAIRTHDPRIRNVDPWPTIAATAAFGGPSGSERAAKTGGRRYRLVTTGDDGPAAEGPSLYRLEEVLRIQSRKAPLGEAGAQNILNALVGFPERGCTPN